MRENPSLNARVRKELLAVRYDRSRCCAQTELLALLAATGVCTHHTSWSIRTNDVLLAQRLLYLCRKALGRHHPIKLQQQPSVSTPGRHRLELFVDALQHQESSTSIFGSDSRLVDARKLARKRACCALAFLRALYWKGGYLSSPRKGFHLEFVLPATWPLDSCSEALRRLRMNLPMTQRRGRQLLYIKGAETISSLVGRLGASQTLLLLQDILITKELKNEVNRGVNCEVGNLRRSSVSAAADVETIAFLRQQCLLAHMPDRLQAVAEARCQFPGLNLTELGQRLDPPLTKAGVFHRLRQLRKEAEIERKRQYEGHS